ncbi:twin-arginine translocase TatA/TatE family subunit [Oleiharenicola lentus]|uniref:twin-arginine translocase TatA/TatE family subunit n=1 Tax=Oleiharenicola lentus TaxID=2508720 RepID=UPI003F6712B0
MSSLAPTFLAIAGIGPTELIIVLIIILLLFGGSKLPSLAKGLGQSIKEFKNAAKDDPEEKDSKKSDASSKSGNN